jgi:hypothetical protein
MTARVASKKPTLDEVLEVLDEIHGAPVHSERLEDPLLDHLLVGVLSRIVGPSKAREAIRAVSEAFLDFNEARVSPLSELQQVLSPYVPEEKLRTAAWDLRMTLQDVYDGTHGLDLEPLRGRDPEDQRAFLKRLPDTPGGPAALVFQLALGDKHLALGPLESHLLERLGMLPRSSNPSRVRSAMEKLIKPADRLRFAWVTGASAHLFEKGDLDPEHPFCKLLVAVKAKELVVRELERKREEARRKAEEKRRKIEDAKRQRLEAIARKKREKDEAKKARQDEIRRKKDEAKKAAAEKVAARKAEARKKAEAKKAEARRRAEAKKAEAARAAKAKKAAAAKKRRG